MVSYITPILEFSIDPLSDTTPTWTDITAYLLEASWRSGVEREGDEPTPGTATFVLDDRTRRFEPDYAAGAFYPNIVPMRRFRWRITSSAVTYDEGIWYATEWQPTWPDRTMMQETVVQCVDGFGVLGQDDLLLMDPPEASSYEEVVGFDEPWGYWRLGEPEGTRLVAHTRLARKRKGQKKRRKIKYRTRETAAEVGGVSGPSGTYKNLPSLGERSLILGDRDTSVGFVSANTNWARIPLEADDLKGNPFSVEAWVRPLSTTPGSNLSILIGPVGPGGGGKWGLQQLTTNDWTVYAVVDAGPTTVSASGGTPTANVVTHLVGTCDGSTLSLYVDGALVASSGISFSTVTIAGSPAVQIGGGVSGTQPFGGLIDEAAVYEYALSAERVLAHYEAGSARGYAENAAGYTIGQIATHALWSEANIQTSGRTCLPFFQFGQSRIETISELAHAEGPKTAFFYNGTGDPFYLGHEWQAGSASYNTPQITIGNNGGAEAPYEDIELVYDDEVYNDIIVSHESGELANETDATSIASIGRRTNTEWTDVLLMEHSDVESLASELIAFYKTASFRPVALELVGEDTTARLHIFARKIGHMIRVKHRPRGGTAIDRVTHILGYEKRLERETGALSCTWNLARGFNAADTFWHAGVTGFSEAGVTTVAA